MNKLFFWGENGGYGVGDGVIVPGAENISTPTQIGSSNWISVATSYSYLLAIREDGKLFAVGSNTYGELGTGDKIDRLLTPIQIGSSNWTSVSTTSYSSAAIRDDGKLFVWGRNQYGQLGNGTKTEILTPTQIGSSNWAKVVVGEFSTLAIRDDGKLFTWGSNQSSQLGDGTIIEKLVPTQIGSSNWTDISILLRHAVAIRDDGKLFVWGTNVSIPNSTYSLPTQIGSSNWIKIAAGWDHTMAIRNDNKLFVWGSNYYGQLGDGTSVNKTVPTQLGSDNWIDISAGYHYSLAIRQDNKLFGWGLNNQGNLGDGTENNRYTPVQIGLGGWESVTANLFTSAGLSPNGDAGTANPPSSVFIAGWNTINANNAAIWNNSQSSSSSGNVTTLGANGGPSYYGTHDQDGNIREWTDSVQDSGKILRGGRYSSIGGKTVRWSYTLPEGLELDNQYIGYGVGARIASSNNPLNLSNFVSVINSGNGIDATGFGQVNYNYQIGKYEITNKEYANFLNAVASSGDTYKIFPTGYSPESSGIRGGLNLSFDIPSNTTTYSTKPHFDEKPANGINWFGFARYCNWLHNEKPVGVQNSLTTESGAYLLLGATSGIFNKMPGAKYWIPTEDEWYKAAYYNGSGNYYTDYATQNNNLPTYVESDQYGRAIFDIDNSSVKHIKIYSNNIDWTDTRVDILPNKLFSIDSSGTFDGIGLNGINSNGIDLAFTNPNLINRRLSYARQFYNGALIGKVGVNGPPFLVGQYLLPKLSSAGGRLYLAINDNNISANNDGFFGVNITTELGAPCKPAKDYRRIQLRRGVESDFVDNYTILASGEPAYAFDTGTLKIGDGSTNWNNLPGLISGGTLLQLSGVVPVKNILAGSGIAVSSVSGIYTIATSGDIGTSTSTEAASLVTTVFNKTSNTINKGSVVYIDGGQGDQPTIQLAIGTSDSGSSKTYGVVQSNIPSMSLGKVVVAGALTGFNTDQFNPTAPHGNVNGVTLWLSPSISGAMTISKPSAPDHMVSVGTIVRTHQNAGVVEVKVQNGFELEELHDVAISGVTNGQFLRYNDTSKLWKATSISAGANVFISDEDTNFVIHSSGGGGSVVIVNSGVNRLLTSDGTTNGITGQANMTFNGSLLNVSGSILANSFTSNRANNINAGSGQIYLNGDTGNRIDFNVNGIGAPQFTNNRSVGTKIVLSPNTSSTQTEYAIGIEAGAMWHSIPISTSRAFKWYAGTASIATLLGDGTLTIGGGNSQINVDDLRLDNNVLSTTATNANLILQPNGNGALLADTSGNLRGIYSNDFQRDRSSVSGVAAGGYNVICGGYDNRTSNSYSTIAGGDSNTSTGIRSTVSGGGSNSSSGIASAIGGGLNNQAGSPYSIVPGGFRGKATRHGELSHAAGFFNAAGDAQHTVLVSRRLTTDGSQQVLTLNGLAPSGTTNIFNIPAQTCWAFEAKISAYNLTNNQAGWWVFKGGIRRNNANSTTLIGNVVANSGVETTLDSSVVDIVADDTNEALEIRVTGVAGKNIRWVGIVDISQVSYGTP